MTTTPTTPAPTGFSLWFRRHRREPWRKIAERPTEAELTALIGEIARNGDWYISATIDPNVKVTSR